MEPSVIKFSTKLDWVPIAVALSPALPLILLVIPSRIQSEAICIVSTNWGNIASVWGLGVSIYLISIARGARKAAQRLDLVRRSELPSKNSNKP